MKHKEDVWGWMLAVDFFFAGMGAAMLVITGLVDFTLGPGQTSLLANFLAPVFIAIGASFLILELGRPFQSWRVFLNPKAILTIGAWNMLVAIGCGVIYASFGIPGIPWAGWIFIRQLLAVVMVLVGIVVATYPGVLLARHKSRPFWTGPGLVGLFMISSLVTGVGAHMLSTMVVPAQSNTLSTVLPPVLAGLLALQLLLWGGYMWVKRTGATLPEAEAVASWINGDQALAFWGGLLGLGTLLPLVLVLLPSQGAVAVGAVLVLLGGLLMRWMVVHAGEHRTWLPGEQNYLSRLPEGDESFLKAWDY